MNPSLPVRDARLTFGTALSRPRLRGPAPGPLNGPLLLPISPLPLPQDSPKYHEPPLCLLLVSPLLRDTGHSFLITGDLKAPNWYSRSVRYSGVGSVAVNFVGGHIPPS